MPLRPPSHLETNFILTPVISSGLYVHFTCTPDGPTYREYNETTQGDDDIDGRFGLFCSDGTFVTSRPWPSEDECVYKPICQDFPRPATAKGFKSLNKAFYTEGEYIYFKCKEPTAVLDDDSGRNYFPLHCVGEEEVGYYTKAMTPEPLETDDTNNTVSNQTSASNETSSNNSTTSNPIFVPVNETFEFPKCRARCKNFYVGRLDFKALDETLEVRAGDVAEFSCKEGYFIEASGADAVMKS